MKFTDEGFKQDFLGGTGLILLTGENKEGRAEALEFLTSPVYKKKMSPLQGEYLEWETFQDGEPLPISKIRDGIMGHSFFLGQWGQTPFFVIEGATPEQERWLRDHGALELRIEHARAKMVPTWPGETVIPWKGRRKFAKALNKIHKAKKRR